MVLLEIASKVAARFDSALPTNPKLDVSAKYSYIQFWFFNHGVPEWNGTRTEAFEALTKEMPDLSEADFERKWQSHVRQMVTAQTLANMLPGATSVSAPAIYQRAPESTQPRV